MDAEPEPFSVPVASDVFPSKKVTVPVGVVEFAGVTFAVRVTELPKIDGLLLDVISTVVTCATSCVNATEVLTAFDGSPAYAAVMECAPTASDEVAKVAVVMPPAVESVPVPRAVPPSRNVTVPEGVPGPVVESVAVKVTNAPGCDGFRLDSTVT